jgi:hypothetical protein
MMTDDLRPICKYIKMGSWDQSVNTSKWVLGKELPL